ncbi:MAG: hypothetical protein ACLQPD_04915 [Desulfomonilaceae bacterium]
MTDQEAGEEKLRKSKDTKVLELIAENFVSHILNRHGILVAKPHFDQEGADLLGMCQVGQAAHFCRIQAKGRSLLNDYNHITIPKKYVDSDFVVFLFIEDGVLTDSNLFCFFEDDIKNWTEDEKNYVLNLKRTNFTNELASNKFTDATAKRIKKMIEDIDMGQVFGYFSHSRFLP